MCVLPPLAYLACARHKLQEQRPLFSCERPQTCPEHLDRGVAGLVVLVLSVSLAAHVKQSMYIQWSAPVLSAGQALAGTREDSAMRCTRLMSHARSVTMRAHECDGFHQFFFVLE